MALLVCSRRVRSGPAASSPPFSGSAPARCATTSTGCAGRLSGGRRTRSGRALPLGVGAKLPPLLPPTTTSRGHHRRPRGRDRDRGDRGDQRPALAKLEAICRTGFAARSTPSAGAVSAGPENTGSNVPTGDRGRPADRDRGGDPRSGGDPLRLHESSKGDDPLGPPRRAKQHQARAEPEWRQGSRTGWSAGSAAGTWSAHGASDTWSTFRLDWMRLRYAGWPSVSPRSSCRAVTNRLRAPRGRLRRWKRARPDPGRRARGRVLARINPAVGSWRPSTTGPACWSTGRTAWRSSRLHRQARPQTSPSTGRRSW